MSPKARALSLIALASLLLSGCGTSSASRPALKVAVRFEQSRCPFTFERGTFTSADVRCGYVVMPERHEQRKSHAIRLAVAVFKSQAAHPAPDPLLYLSGGPGGALVGPLGSQIAMAAMPSFVGDRDLILVDQRGAGLSKPSLACNPDESDQGCRDRLVHDGIDLAAYNSIENADDMAELPGVLGYKQFDIYGGSYGSTLALHMMRDHPGNIRSATMNAVAGPVFDPYDDWLPTAWRAFHRIFMQCAASASCNAQYPHLERTFDRLLSRLQAHPVTLEAYSVAEKRQKSATMNGVGFWLHLQRAIGDHRVIPRVPSIITETAAGKYTQIGPYAIGEGASVIPASEAWGMHLSVGCSEWQARSSPKTIAEHARGVPVSIRSALIDDAVNTRAECDIWKVPSIPAVYHTYFRSSIPTLLLPGGFDPKTPPAQATVLARKLRHAYLVHMPTLSHSVLGDSCANSVMTAFLEKPSKRPDTSCAQYMSILWE